MPKACLELDQARQNATVLCQLCGCSFGETDAHFALIAYSWIFTHDPAKTLHCFTNLRFSSLHHEMGIWWAVCHKSTARV
jgi:hypothetical protein